MRAPSESVIIDCDPRTKSAIHPLHSSQARHPKPSPCTSDSQKKLIEQETRASSHEELEKEEQQVARSESAPKTSPLADAQNLADRDECGKRLTLLVKVSTPAKMLSKQVCASPNWT